MSDAQHQVDDLFLRAIALEGSAREDFLADVVRSDPIAGAQLRELIAANARMPTSFLAGSRPGEGATAPHPEWIGPYRLVREIGRGGMGVVYEAEQQHPRRRVAIKLVPPAFASEQLLERFRFEAEVLGQLESPGIARIYDAGSADVGGVSTPYIVMEHIEGLPLDEHVASRGLPRRQIVELVARVCDAVQYAHQRGVIHRDLKPSNILVTVRDAALGASPSDGGSGIPKILDFGVARLVGGMQSEAMHTAHGISVGTPE
ncbi:MAG: serine/threonine-protein kinase, partial [Planctomycetota bacterium]